MPYALLIDDDVALVQSVVALAEAFDVELLTATAWQDGLDLFITLSPDLVIADYNLPGSDSGLQLLLEAKQLRPGIRVVLLSGYLTEEQIQAVGSSRLVERALRKNPAGMEAVSEELQGAKERAGAATDWVRVAEGYESAVFDDGEISRLMTELRGAAGVE
jgi:CheY-like chemotaxis protein